MPFLISLEANIDNSGLGQIRPCWLFSFLIFYVDKRQLTKTRLIPVCTENLTLILNFIKKISSGHRIGVCLKALHEQLLIHCCTMLY